MRRGPGRNWKLHQRGLKTYSVWRGEPSLSNQARLSWGQILGRNPDKNLPPCYSQSPLFTALPWDFYFFKLTQPLMYFYGSVTVHCKGERTKTDRKPYPPSQWFTKSIQKPQVWELSKLCPLFSQKPQRNSCHDSCPLIKQVSMCCTTLFVNFTMLHKFLKFYVEEGHYA